VSSIHTGKTKPSGNRFWGRVVLIAVAAILMDLSLEQILAQRYRYGVELALVHQMGSIRARLEKDINGSLLLIHGVEVNISTNPEITREEFVGLARTMMHHPNLLKNIAMAPDFVVRYVYPEKGNEAVLGIDYRDLPKQWAQALKARETGALILAGPLNLVQGGTGLIGRAPVYVDTRDGPRFWGLVSAVIDADRLFERAGLGEAASGLSIALRGRDGLGSDGEAFYGPADLFDPRSGAALMTVTLPNGSWQMAAVPEGGWPAGYPYAWPIRLTVLVLAGLMLYFIRVRLGDAARRREAAIALRESEQRFRDLTLASADWVWEIDIQLRYTYASGRVEGIMGYTAEEMIGKSPFETMTEEDARTIRPVFKEAMAARAPIRELENWNRAKDGRLVFLLTNGLPILDEEGNMLGYRGVGKDITRRKRSEMELQEARQHVYKILESTTDAFFEVDADFNLTYINRRAEESIGLRRDEHLGMNLWEVFPKAEGTHFYAEYHRALKEQVVVSLEAYYPPFDAWHQIHAYPTPNSLSVYFHDITERKRLELERESIFQLSLDMIAIAGFDGYFKEINPSWERILGWSREEFLGRPWLDFVHPDDVQATIEAGRGLAEGKTIISFENRYRRRDGSYRWISWNSRPVPDQQLIFAVARDVTELIQAREILQRDRDELEARVEERTAALAEANRDLLRAKEEAEAASRAKSQFLANISHELRTPLNPVIGLAEYLQETELNDEQHRFIADIRQASGRLLRIINNLIELTRIDSQGLELDVQPFSLEELIEGLALEMRPEAEARGLAIETRLGPEAPRQVESDPRYLRKALALLMENAIKFTEQGRVTLAANLDRDETGRDVLHFTVIDTGVGIPAENLESLFKDLTQIDGSMTRKFGGLGLGLTLARRIANQMDGRIWVESRESGGSRFHLALPFGECCHWDGLRSA